MTKKQNKIIENINKYEKCPKCGKYPKGTNKDFILIDNKVLIRKCECGFYINIDCKE